MKNKLKISLFGFVFLFTFSAFAQLHRIEVKNHKQLQKFFRYTKDNHYLVSAHRGGPMSGFPENCIETFENTLRQTFAVIECDVQLTKDSVLVMMHDNTLERTTNGKGNLNDYTWEELQKLNLKDNQGILTAYKIPSLEQVLTWAKGKTLLTLDIKRGVPAAKVNEIIRRLNVENYALVITYNLKSALEYFALNEKVMLSVSINEEEKFWDYQKSNVNLKRVIAFTGVSKVNQRVLELLHNQNVTCMLGTMGELDKQAKQDEGKTYQKLISQNIDMFATDEPVLASKALQNIQPKKSKKAKYFRVE